MPKRLLVAFALATILSGAAAAQGIGGLVPLGPTLGAFPDREPSEGQAQTMPARKQTACCVVCKKGIPCGNSCISAKKTCRKGRGCAC